MQPDAAEPVVKPAEWAIVPSLEADSVVVQLEVDEGLISVKCDDQACQTLILTEAVCEAGSLLPVLVNTMIESGVAEGQCLPVDITEEAPRIKNAILLTEPNLLMPNMILGDRTSLAIPMADGTVKVFVVEMDGIRELIAPLIPELFESPGWLNEHGMDSMPDDDAMDDDEIIEWQRGLFSI